MLQNIDSLVRFAGPEDEAELLRLCRAKHAEDGMTKLDGTPFSFSEDRCRATLHRAIIPNRNHPTMAWCGVIGDMGGPLRASVYVSIQQPFDSEDQYLLERWNWIYPEYRKSNDYGRLLLAFSYEIGYSHGLRVMSGVISDDEDSAKMRFYRRNGAKRLGAMFICSPMEMN